MKLIDFKGEYNTRQYPRRKTRNHHPC